MTKKPDMFDPQRRREAQSVDILCQNCAFWQMSEEKEQERRRSNLPEAARSKYIPEGECRRVPPTAVLVKSSGGSILGPGAGQVREMTYLSAWMCPQTSAVDWCGEFRPRPPGGTA